MQTSSFLTGVLSFFGTIRSHIIGFFQAVLPASAAGLLLGIVFGIREQIPPEFNRAFQSSGVLHVVAASGANVSIVISMVASVFMMVFTRRFALFLIIPAVFCYSLLAGFDPPIVRAAIMGLLAILAGLFGRQYLGILALGMTGWFMLMVWPYLLFDVGFQLSFLATLGIILIKPLLPASQAERGGQGENGAGGPFQSVKRVMFLPIEDIRTTLAAQIATLPVLFFFFGQYGILSLLANAATLWMIPVLMILGLFAALLSFIPLVSIVANGLLLLALPLLLLFEKIIFVVGDLHTDILFTPPLAMVAGYYFLLGAVILFCKNSKLKVKN